ncbi:alpha/beta hydrolase family protein [Planobispora siamensis]|nr:prolyl oligopeptidase family serine peptidase [Planobispora siamensis]
MLARSPIGKVDQVRTPLMIVQGVNDVRVVQEESDLMMEALRARDAEVEYLTRRTRAAASRTRRTSSRSID